MENSLSQAGIAGIIHVDDYIDDHVERELVSFAKMEYTFQISS